MCFSGWRGTQLVGNSGRGRLWFWSWKRGAWQDPGCRLSYTSSVLGLGLGLRAQAATEVACFHGERGARRLLRGQVETSRSMKDCVFRVSGRVSLCSSMCSSSWQLQESPVLLQCASGILY